MRYKFINFLSETSLNQNLQNANQKATALVKQMKEILSKTND